MPVNCCLDARDVVGESLVWDERRRALWWVDIVGKRIHCYTPETSRHETWPTPDFPTSIGLCADGGFIVGLTREVGLWTPSDGFESLATPEPDLPDNRLNEGRVAPDGSFWVGTMQNNLTNEGRSKDITRSSGAIYRISANGKTTQLTPREFGIVNTMIWMRDGRFITADTLVNTLYEYDCNAADGLLADRRVFAQGPAQGLPDGSCIDASERIWNCRVVEGSAVACFSPRGELERLVELPCAWPTSCTFGGPDLRTLYVTSARFTMSPERLSANPLEGGLFSCEIDAVGVLEHRFG